MVEFALVLIPVLLIVIGMLQFGIALNAKINETHLASSGARYAAVNQNPGAGDDMSLQDYLKSKADTGDMRAASSVCIEFPTNSETSTAGLVGDPVKVTMSYDYDLIPLLGERLDPPLASVTVVGDAVMRLEALPSDIAEGCSS